MKKLNIELVNQRLEGLGLSPSGLADQLGVTKQSVSYWLNHKKFPRPAKLLKLATILKLSFQDIVIKEDSSLEPVIAFRKKGSHRISPEYIEDAIDKGYLLEQLVPYLPYDNLSTPPVLKNPILDYDYIHKVTSTVRREIGKTQFDKIKFEDLIDFFNTNYAVLIPVFGGHKKNHENALHVFLPSSITTWIYLNLDSKIHDFKFWMAHELGHTKTPNLHNDEAEDFADKFAGSLLVSSELAEREYLYLMKLSGNAKKVSRIIEVAKELLISPLTIYYEINRYAEYAKKQIVNLEDNQTIFRANTAFCSSYENVAQTLFHSLPPDPKKYIETCECVFKTPFFNSAKNYLRDNQKSPNFLQAVMSLTPIDAHALYDEMCR